MKCVALYVRLSPRPDGQYEGVDRQEQWGRSYAAKTWPGVPVRVFADTGLSAANGGQRPGYESLRQAIVAGEVAHLWCVEQSRIERTEGGWFLFADELTEAGVTEVHTDRDGVLRVEDAVAGIKAVLNAYESRRLKRRTNDTLDALADAGRPGPGNHVAYRRGRDAEGRSTLEPIPEVADALRWAATAVLSGWTLTDVADELAARGIPTSKGGQWRHDTVRSALLSPTAAAKRVHRGQIHRDGNWEPVLDEATWRQLVARLGDRHRQPARKHLLSGIAVCGRCGHGLTGHVDGTGRRSLICSRRAGGCGRMVVAAEPLDRHVTETLLDRLDRPEFYAALTAGDEDRRAQIVADLDGIEAQQVTLARRWATGAVPDAAWDAARESLHERQVSLSAELAALPAPTVWDDPEVIRAGWSAMTINEQREVLSLFIEAVVVQPATRRGPVFDTGRVDPERDIVWRKAR